MLSPGGRRKRVKIKIKIKNKTEIKAKNKISNCDRSPTLSHFLNLILNRNLNLIPLLTIPPSLVLPPRRPAIQALRHAPVL